MNSVLVDRVKVDDRGRITLDIDMRKRMSLKPWEEVEVRYIEGGNAKMIQITKVEKSK